MPRVLQAVYIREFDDWRTVKQTLEDSTLTKKQKFDFKDLALRLIKDDEPTLTLLPKTPHKWRKQ
jgi:hypothetical protein